jgi:hypothetical protein
MTGMKAKARNFKERMNDLKSDRFILSTAGKLPRTMKKSLRGTIDRPSALCMIQRGANKYLQGSTLNFSKTGVSLDVKARDPYEVVKEITCDLIRQVWPRSVAPEFIETPMRTD